MTPRRGASRRTAEVARGLRRRVRPRAPTSGRPRAAPESEPRVDPRRAEPRHPLPLRPPRRRRTAGDPPAARAARAHPRAVVLDADRPPRSLPQLAAGPAVELARARGVPGEDARVAHRGRPGRRDGGLQPVRLLPGAARGAVPVRLRTLAAARARAVPGARRGDAGLRGAPRRDPARRDAHGRLPGRAEPGAAAGGRVPDPDGARRADARRDARQRLGLVPRLGLAAGAAAAPPRPRRALRVGLPDPAGARREVARRPVGRRARLHRPARVVRGLPGSGWTPPRGCSRARATCPSPARPSRRRPRR